MGRNTGLVLTFFFSGILLIGLGYLVSKWMEGDSPTSVTLAKIEIVNPQVFILRKHLTEKETLQKRASLHALESVETNAEGEAILDFPSSYRIRILPNSQLTLDSESERTILYIKAGDIKIENFGRDGTVFISKAGLRTSASEYDAASKNQSATSEPAVKNSEFSEGLSPTYIQDTLKSQRSTFYKCYTQLLQKKPGVTGEVSISITIEPSGKVSRAEITNTPLEDPSFKKCLIEASSHIEFRPFQGEPITTLFPLKFE